MPKINMGKTKNILLRFLLKIILTTAAFTILFTSLVSLIVLKTDMDPDYILYFGFAIDILSAFFISFFCARGFKNNRLMMSVISVLPLMIIALANFFSENFSIIYFFIKLGLIIISAAVSAILNNQLGKKIRV